MTFTRDPIITRWHEAGELNPGFLAIKTGKNTELVVCEYSESAQDKLLAEWMRREDLRLGREHEAQILRNRPEVIEGELVDGVSEICLAPPPNAS